MSGSDQLQQPFSLSTPATQPTTIDAPSSPTTPPFSPITPEMSRAKLSAQLPSQPGTAQPNPPSNGTSRPIVLIPSQPKYTQPTTLATARPAPTPSSRPPQSPSTSMPPPPLPVTPSQARPQPAMMREEPPLEPLDLETNPDAIALRAAMSLLQLQRQQAIRDLQTLQTQKRMALQDPKAFVAAVKKGDVRTRARDAGSAGIDFDYGSVNEQEDDDDDEDEDEDTAMAEVRDEQANSATKQPGLKMDLPTPQNVVRAPPVEWGKYHVVGPALDRLHEQQITNPAPSRPRTDEDVRLQKMQKLARDGVLPGRKWDKSEAGIMAPYDVFKDEIVGAGDRGAAATSEGGHKKKPSAGGGKAAGGAKATDSKRRKSSGLAGGSKKKGKAKATDS